MLRFILYRLASAIPTLVVVALAVFVLIRAIPGDPVTTMLGDQADPATVQALRQAYGLDGPWPWQFVLWVERLASGDLGQSITNGLPVAELVADRFSVTAGVVFPAVLIATLVAVPLDMIAAWRRGAGTDLAITACATLLMSIPTFWLGLLILMWLGLNLGWLPIVGYVGFAEDAGRALAYLVMPVLTLTIVEIGILTRMARANTVEVLRLEYVTHARAKGLPEHTVMARHVFPNAFAPTLTLVGLILGNLLGGIAVTETIFSLPGLGRLLVDAIYARDYPVVQGGLLFIAGLYVVINLIVDLLHPLFDPRVAA